MSSSVLITGCDKGLGYSLTKLFLQKGFHVYSCLHREPSEKILELKKNFKGKFDTVQMDVADDSSIRNALAAFSGLTDSLDIIINNAGVHFDLSHNALEDVDFDVALETLNINSLGPLRVTKSFLPFLEKGKKPVLVNISSEAGSISNSWREKEFDYCMSKSALNMQSVMIQKLVKPKGIKVLAIHPGWMRTDMGGSNADIESDTAAEGIFQLIEKYGSDLEGPIYMDYTGALMSW